MTTSHPSSSLSAILNNFCYLRIIFLPSANFSWYLSILPFSIALIVFCPWCCYLLCTWFFFLLLLNSGTVELLISLTASSVVYSTKSSGSVLFKLSRTVYSIVLTVVVVISAMISFFCLSIHIGYLLSWISL